MADDADEELIDAEDLEGLAEHDFDSEELEGDPELLGDLELDEDALDEFDVEDDLVDDLVDVDLVDVLEAAEKVEEPAPALRPDDDDDDDDDELDPDDVEASLDVILKDRLVIEDAEIDEDDEQPETEDRGETAGAVVPKRPDEFVCQSCFLVKHPSQLADAKRILCRDCV